MHACLRRAAASVRGDALMNDMTTETNGDDVAADDPIVGHKTMRRKDGSRYHVPLRQSEADALWARIEAEEKQEETGRGTD